jgi:cytoskeletal protein CcmA (bactofilin family)
MFIRKRTETEDRKMAESSDDLGIPMKPVRPAAAPPAAPTRPVAMPPRAPDLARASDAIRPPDPLRRPGDPFAAPRRNDGELRKLTVGREITLSGEITCCDMLVIEGSVEANLTNCRDINIAESGLFKGAAAIEEAEIRGRFEGNLTVRQRLLVRATGRVSGTIRYGQIEIECGGQISGDIQAQATAEDVRPTAEAVPVRAAAS